MIQTLLRPVITEKSMREAQLGRFTFQVLPSATKTEIKKEVERTYNVNVVRIQTIMKKGDTKRVGKRGLSQEVPPAKKAVVALKAGQKIDIFDIQGGKES